MWFHSTALEVPGHRGDVYSAVINSLLHSVDCGKKQFALPRGRSEDQQLAAVIGVR
jgi:hypothetical protein